VSCQVLGGKQKLLFRCRLLLVESVVVKRVHTHIAFDRHGLVFLALNEEHDSSAKAANGRFAGLIQRGIGPNGQHIIG